MGQLYGLTKRQLLERQFASAKSQLTDYIKKENENIQQIIEQFNETQKNNKNWGYALLNIPFGTLRGMVNGSIDLLTTFAAVVSQLRNNISHIVDNEDKNLMNDVAYLFTDLGASFLEGVGAGAVGAVADAGALFGLGTKWAYDPSTGFIPQMNKNMNRLRVNVLEGENILTNSNLNEEYRSTYNDEYVSQSDKQKLDARWQTEEIDGNKHEEFREDTFQMLKEAVNRTSYWKEIVNGITLKNKIQEEAGDTKLNKFIEPVFESIGRLIPSIVLGKMASTGGVHSQALATSAKAWFASSVYGQSFEEAVKNGASMQDAYTYAFGNMALELATEQMFGLKLGSGKIGSLTSSVMGEAIEEAVAEVGARGLGYYNNKENQINTQESVAELRARVQYAAVVGAISGGIFKVGSGVYGRIEGSTTQGKINNYKDALAQDINEKGTDKTKSNLIKTVSALEKTMHGDNETAKKAIMENSFSKDLFKKEVIDGETSYVLSEIGVRIKQGNILPIQNGKEITKDTHAVGRNNLLNDYAKEVTFVNKKGEKVNQKIEIIEKDEISKNKNKDIINEVLKAGWNVAFTSVVGRNVQVNSQQEFDAFTDPNTGIIYVNVNSSKGIANLLSHEIHDKLSVLARNNELTKSQKNAFLKFEKTIGKMASDELLSKLDINFDEDAYREQYKGKKDLEFLISMEKVSAFIQQSMNNEKILYKALKMDRNLFTKIAGIFTNPLTYNKMLKEMNLNKKDNKKLISIMTKIQKTWAKAIKANEVVLKTSRAINDALFGKSAANNLFSLDNDGISPFKNINLEEEDLNMLWKEFPEIYNKFVKTSLTYDDFFDTNFLEGYMESVYFINRTKSEKDDVDDLNSYLQNYKVLKSGDLYDKGYFLKYGDFYYNKEDFKFLKDAIVDSFRFSAFENAFVFNFSSHGQNFEQRYILPRKIYYKDGKIKAVKNPVLFEASIKQEQLDFLIKKGFLPNQSLALMSAGGAYFKTNRMYGPVTFVVNKNILKQKDFVFWGEDIFTPIRFLFEKSGKMIWKLEAVNWDKHIQLEAKWHKKNVGKPVEGDVLEEDNIKYVYIYKTWFEAYVLDPNKKIKVMQETINYVLDNFGTGNVGYEYHKLIGMPEDSTDIEVDDVELLFRGIKALTFVDKNTPKNLKKEINEYLDLDNQQSIYKQHEDAIVSLVALSKYFDFKGIIGLLKEYRNGVNVGEGNNKIDAFYPHLEKIERYLSHIGGDLIGISPYLPEGKVELRANHIAGIKFDRKWYDYTKKQNLEEIEKNIKEFAKLNNIPLYIGENIRKEEALEQFGINEIDNDFLFSLDSEKMKQLKTLNTMRRLEREITETGFTLTKDAKGNSVDISGNPLTLEQLDLLKYAVTVPKKDFNYEYVISHPAYRKYVEKVEEFENEIKKEYNIDSPESIYIDTPERQEWRRKYIESAVEKVKKSKVQKDKKLMIVIGLPAAGKSSKLVKHIQKARKAYLADSDNIKDDIPNAHGLKNNIHHEESKYLNKEILNILEKDGYNIVLPIIGGTESQVMRYAKKAKKLGYKVELYYNEVSKEASAKRGLSRLIVDLRYIPFKTFTTSKKDPDLVYETLKGDEIFDGYYKQNNDVGFGKQPILKEIYGSTEFIEFVKGTLSKVTEHDGTTYLEPRGSNVDAGVRIVENDNGIGRQSTDSKVDETTEITKEIETQLQEQEYIDEEDAQEVEKTITQETKNEVETEFQEKKKAPKRTLYEVASKQAKISNKKDYVSFEKIFAKNKDDILKIVNHPKNEIENAIQNLYKNWEKYINKIRDNKQFYNHMGSQAAKRIIFELYTLNNIIQNDKSREDKKPTEIELQYIARKVNQTIYDTLDYTDKDVLIEINKKEDNPQGYAFTRAIYWYFRDMAKIEVWDKETNQKFNKDARGFAYRRLINAIINYNTPKAKNELASALRHFVYATNVERVSDIALDSNAPRTIYNAKRQWERNTKNIIKIKKAIDYKTNINSWLDPFTVGNVVGLHDPNSWSNVLNEKIKRGMERQITIDRAFAEHFEKENWLKRNYKKIVDLENPKKAYNVKSLGGVNVRLSQIVYLRDMVLREVVRNKAIDLELLEGKKTNHFNKGNEVDILAKTFIKTKKMDNKQVGIVTSPLELLEELESKINSDPFLLEYNNKIVEFFNLMFPYVNERFKEINGMNLSNDGVALQELSEEDKNLILEDLPEGLTSKSLEYIYIPFLLHDSSYFKQNKINFKGIIDLGIFDGMTEELSDSNGIVSVESITEVVSSYAREVGNYYGLHRIMMDLNTMLNEKLDSSKQTAYISRNIDEEIIKFYSDLLLDMAGYKTPVKNPKMNRTLSWFRRNFYRASLAANIKVIGSQMTTMFNLSILYGDGYLHMLPKMMKNFFAQATKENRTLIKEMENNNNIFWDRKRNSTFEIGQATEEGFSGNNNFNRIMQKLMDGIRITDNSINKALYLTLLEKTNPKTGEKYTKEEATEVLNQAILRSQSSALAFTKSSLLRTDNEVFKIMIKFLGEPMKLITQIYDSIKENSLVKKIEMNKNQILQNFEEEIAQATKEYEEVKTRFDKNESIINSGNYNLLEESEQKKIHKKYKDLQKEMLDKQEKLNDAVENKKIVQKQLNDIIGRKEDIKKLALRRYMTFVSATIYLALLASGFQLLRSKGGEKDKPEDETQLKYLLKMLTTNFADSLAGMFPFIRDAYQVLAMGFNVSDIDEFNDLNNLGKSFNYLFQNIVSGKEMNTGKTIRNIAIYGGKVFGVPMLQLERLITTPLLYLDESSYFQYMDATGRQTRENIELKQAIKDGDERMIQTIVETKIKNRDIKISPVVTKELTRLASKGYEVKMVGVNDSFTSDGVKYVLNSKQKEEFRKIYERADYIIQKMLLTPYYKRLNDDMKQSLLLSIYNYYYRMAKQDIFDLDLIPEKNYYATLPQAYKYFLTVAEQLYKKQKSQAYMLAQKKAD